MDRNSIIGLLIIGGILIGWLWISQPSKEEIALQQHIRDSIEQFNETEKVKAETAARTVVPAKTVADTTVSDSVRAYTQAQQFGPFAQAAAGKNEYIDLENDLMKVRVATRGGRIASVTLKNYKTFTGEDLALFHPDSSSFGLTFSAGGKVFHTDSLYFEPQGSGIKVTGTDSKNLSMRLYAGDKAKYIEFVYGITGGEYMMTSRINVVGMQQTIAGGPLKLKWWMKTPAQEQTIDAEQRSSTIYFKAPDENVDKISEATDEKKSMETATKWIGFKQQFFTSVLIADNAFEKAAEVETKTVTGSAEYVKDYSAIIPLPLKGQQVETFGMRMYFGPNHYQTLKKYDIGLERQINLGWKIFGWVNRFIVIPIFNFLDGFNLNYGIIILILTIILKILLLPIAYRTVLSSAKMRVLKPEIDELNEKHKNDDPMKKQQATMALYRKAGVNPMAGCIPVLLQMPILIALFNFFPASIELRQQGFLWAHDLSTYDSVYNFGFNIPWYGDHVSLFALLMTVSTLLYTWSNSQLMGSNNQMPGMKWMMYLMPVLFLGFMNSYSAGLSWYYFLANMITFLQTWIMQKFVIDHDKLHKQIQENKTKPVKVSKFQQRLEAMAKEAQTRQQKKK